MKRLIMLVGLILSTSSYSAVDLSSLLNRVTLTLNAEQWVTTKTALLTVVANASVTDQGIATIQGNVLEKLKRISDQGQWHVVSFNRQQDQSGLENIQILAQARIPQSDLAGLRNRAKAISKPGETFTISNVELVPSDDEIKQANQSLRGQIYDQAKAEISRLNTLYPDQHYYLYNMDFNQSPVMPMASAMYMEKAQTNRVSAQPLDVGNKMHMQANITIASMPSVVTQVLSKQ